MSTRILDVQNEMHGALLALDGLRDLAFEAQGPDRQAFELLSPACAAELLEMVADRFHKANRMLDEAADEIFGRS